MDIQTAKPQTKKALSNIIDTRIEEETLIDQALILINSIQKKIKFGNMTWDSYLIDKLSEFVSNPILRDHSIMYNNCLQIVSVRLRKEINDIDWDSLYAVGSIYYEYLQERSKELESELSELDDLADDFLSGSLFRDEVMEDEDYEDYLNRGVV